MPNNPFPTIILTDSDGLAHNTEPTMLILQIERDDIEKGNIASTLEKLLIISDTRENALLYRESLVFQVQGYDHDKRELPEIPEVRAFFTKLNKAWPHWMWFLCRDIGAIALLLALLCKVKIHRQAGSYGTEFLHPNEIQRCMMDMFDRGNAMFRAYGISTQDAAESASSAVAEIQ
ncbi:chlororespiratory reduction 6 domain-containing protein [Diaphorobacter sp. J5-51]|uniref:chlororespiratory reduction 6 domain-containing protein n=1 Tax=Diaphorobacter sp. J5-51 TaxID=680496 RepID=UPI000643E296|nr:chlororespiratory reduction 6 domain-containing protein [Diaphorobacter sp. J5-51]KLR57302.1 hypothetical protein OX89_13220 [Diaphorobacter sp. J5-51]